VTTGDAITHLQLGREHAAPAVTCKPMPSARTHRCVGDPPRMHGRDPALVEANRDFLLIAVGELLAVGRVAARPCIMSWIAATIKAWKCSTHLWRNQP